MGHSSPFVSSCSRRQWARRRSGRSRRAGVWMPLPLLATVLAIAVGVAAFVAARGGF
jgi:hypothetical protein